MKQRKPVFRLIQSINNNRVSLFVHSAPYAKTYTKGKIVTANKDSIGIFCFRTKKEATVYKDTKFLVGFQHKVEIIKVLPIGRGISPKKIAYYYTKECITIYNTWLKRGKPSLQVMLKTEKKVRFMSPAKGVICYPAVKVLT